MHGDFRVSVVPELGEAGRDDFLVAERCSR
jgi:hypothetical protein